MIVSIKNLYVRLPRGADRNYAVRDLSLDIDENEIVCVVGESGSGKSVMAAALLRLLPPGLILETGRVVFEDRDLLALPLTEMRAIRGAGIGMIFQDPMTALNPLHRIGDQIAEVFRTHTISSGAEIHTRTLDLLAQMGLPDPPRAARAYPYELSGGQRQRAMIAMALALEPRLLIADEPTTALDVTTQARILRLLRDLQQRSRMGVLFITHDFGVVAEIATRIAVMRHGSLVEQGPASQVLGAPAHDYTKQLIAAVPSLRPPTKAALAPVGRSILSVLGLNKTYGQKGRSVAALKDVTLALRPGSTLGVVGESGSGKSTLARCIVRLLEADSGAIEVDGADVRAMKRVDLRRNAGRVQMVFQDPYASLNPRRKVGDVVAQGPLLHGGKRSDVRARVRELFQLVGLDPAAMDRYPHEFSGGQCQRIGLARALAMNPSILIADEPVSALDVSVQAQVLKLIADIQHKLGLSVIFITHDLRVAAQICDRVAIMKDGEVVEEGLAADVLVSPQHAYSQALISAVPGRTWRSHSLA